MAVIQFRSAGFDAEKDSGTVAMFGSGIGDDEHWSNFSCFFLPDVMIGGLEMLSIAFLLLILCDYIPVYSLVFILAPFALIFFLASVASSVANYRLDESVKMSGYVSQCWNRISKKRLGALLSVFSAKCALIFIYSKNLSNANSPSKYLSALASISVDQTSNATVHTNFYVMSLVCICIIMIFESGLFFTRIKVNDALRHKYALALSIVDTLSVSIFFLSHRVIERQKELLHFRNIIAYLPMLFMIVAAVRCLVFYFVLKARSENNEIRCVYALGIFHLCMAISSVVFYLWPHSETLFALKMICCTAIAERFLLVVIHLYLGYVNRQARRLPSNRDPSSPRLSPSQRLPLAAESADAKSRQRLLPADSHRPSQGSLSRPSSNNSAASRYASPSVSDASNAGKNSGARRVEQSDGGSALSDDAYHRKVMADSTFWLEQAKADRAKSIAQAKKRTERILRRQPLERELEEKRRERGRLQIEMQGAENQLNATRNQIMITRAMIHKLQVKELIPLEEELKALQAREKNGEDTADLIQQKVDAIATVRTKIGLEDEQKTALEMEEFRYDREFQELARQVGILSTEMGELSRQIDELSHE